eukprot:CAMPEP_0116545052 /NCGR_PEP_ID=MMETSP0397-20121206/2456_1 /TAXON_ID=216820 /ORGANISM="Cyclophora tenuis, Strain ECT3854" /LENGTH=162 /DNA_ID=CAMNT_0004069327 /DNA_START=1122 /DNA_END=1606 /DNA_ORIENTATION=-
MEKLPFDPQSWGVDDTSLWAREVAKLNADTVQSLLDNEVDGSTLVALEKEDLRTELGMKSLAARKYLWHAIERVRWQHESSDYSLAIDLHQKEIDGLAAQHPGDANKKKRGHHHHHHHVVDDEVLNLLQSDAQRQRQIMEDHFLAHRLQLGGGGGGDDDGES